MSIAVVSDVEHGDVLVVEQAKLSVAATRDASGGAGMIVLAAPLEVFLVSQRERAIEL